MANPQNVNRSVISVNESKFLSLMDQIELLRGQVQSDSPGIALSHLLKQTTDHIYQLAHQTFLVPFFPAVQKLEMIAMQTARFLEKKVVWKNHGTDLDLYLPMIEGLEWVLQHVVRNAVDHGVDPAQKNATIRLLMNISGGSLMMSLEDNGPGANIKEIRAKMANFLTPEKVNSSSDSECLEFLFRTGFSTRTQVGQISGRGVGLDIVRTRITEMGGTVQAVNSVTGGFTLQFQVPLKYLGMRAIPIDIGKLKFWIRDQDWIDSPASDDGVRMLKAKEITERLVGFSVEANQLGTFQNSRGVKTEIAISGHGRKSYQIFRRVNRSMETVVDPKEQGWIKYAGPDLLASVDSTASLRFLLEEVMLKRAIQTPFLSGPQIHL